MCNNILMSSSNLLKNIISKDKNIFENTIKNLLRTGNTADFEELCKKSDFIFPFIKDKIIDYFVKIVNKEDLNIIFKFSKIYSFDFEDIIVKSWLKFADEDLTDEILELFENGTDEQKSYCAKYFTFIKDSLSLENLEKYIYSDFEPLRINSALALKAFGQNNVLNDIKNKVISCDNEYDKIPLYQILSVWGGSENIKFILENSISSLFTGNIISNILDYNEFDTLKKYLDKNTVFNIFNVLIENYPENIELNTIAYYQIYDFIEYLKNNLNQYSNNLLALARRQFLEYETNEIYNFDLDKDTKNELKRINESLNAVNPDFSNLEQELKSNNPYRFETAIKVIQEYKINLLNSTLADLMNNNNTDLRYRALIAQTLKSLGCVNLIDKNEVTKIQNDNIKALILDLI